MSDYRPVKMHPLHTAVGLFTPGQDLSHTVRMDSPAVLVMTDLRQQAAFTVEPGVSIDQALQKMKTAGVRLLFVTDNFGEISGLITSTDIQGEKPIRLHQERKLRRVEIVVGDIMTPYEELEVINIADVLRASVGDIVVTLQLSGRRHALVLDLDTRTETHAIRGIFSVSRLGKQLGQSIETTEVARTFAEVEVILNS